MRVTLASASPRRSVLIKKIPNLEVTVKVSGADESAVKACSPIELVKALALLKAKSVAKETEGVIIGADTVVAVDNMVLGKPRSADEARTFFKMLCGRTHEVITGIAVVNGQEEIVDAEVSFVTFFEYDEEIIERYIESGSPFDKAGGYGIQDELFKPMVKSVKGCTDNVIGLPVELLRRTIEEKLR